MLIALLWMTVFVTGCATKPIEYCEPVTLYQDRYIPIDESLTQPVEVVGLPADFDLIDLGVAYKANRVRIEQCNGRLAEIAGNHSQ
jgi:hypothetical protein